MKLPATIRVRGAGCRVAGAQRQASSKTDFIFAKKLIRISR